MSLIDKLRSQADEVRQAQEAEQQRAARREQVYRQIIIPKLMGIIGYYSELFDHLNLVKPDVKVGYKINGVGEFCEMRQEGYLVTADSNTNTKLVKISYDCNGDAPVTVEFTGKRQVQESVRYLLENGVKFTHKVIPGNFRREERVECTIQPVVSVSIQFEADIENSVIHMSSINHENIGSWRRVLQPNDIDESFCDELGRYIVREIDQFRTTQLSQETREQLAAKVQAEKSQRQQELDRAVARMMDEEEEGSAVEKKPAGVLGLFKRPGSK